MFSDLSVLNYLIYAAGIGFAFAIIYTNIQRTAFSNFVSFLIDNNCFDENSAVSLSVMNLPALQNKIIASALKNHYGFRRSIKAICDEKNTKADSDEFFTDASQSSSKYYICDSDIENLKKKYSYKTMPTKTVILFIAALIAVVIICSSLINWLLSSISAPKLESNTNETPYTEDFVATENETPDEEILSDSTETEDELLAESGDESPAGPRIPV